MSPEQAADEAEDFIKRNFKEVNILVWGATERLLPLMKTENELLFDEVVLRDTIWRLIRKALAAHYQNKTYMNQAINWPIRVEVKENGNFDNPSDDEPTLTILAVVAPSKVEAEVPSRQTKSGGPIGHGD